MQNMLNGILCVLAAAGLSFVVLSHRINEGAWIKLGLIAMIFGLIVSAMDYFWDLPDQTVENATLVLHGGIVAVCIGYWLKFRRHRRDGTPTDFGSLTER